jgi:hypothetical protein
VSILAVLVIGVLRKAPYLERTALAAPESAILNLAPVLIAHQTGNARADSPEGFGTC